MLNAESKQEKVVSVGTFTVNKATISVDVHLPHTTNHFVLDIKTRKNDRLQFCKHTSVTYTFTGERLETDLKVPEGDNMFSFRRK